VSLLGGLTGRIAKTPHGETIDDKTGSLTGLPLFLRKKGEPGGKGP